MVSEDLDELMLVADRIVVLHDGEVAGVVDAVGRRPPGDRSPDARKEPPHAHRPEAAA